MQTIPNLDQLFTSSDVVVTDYPAYYELGGRARQVFGVDYAGGKLMPRFPEFQSASVTKLLVRDSRFSEVATKVGGTWRRIADLKILRNGHSTPFVISDDDTRHPKTERVGLYVRDSATTAVP